MTVPQKPTRGEDAWSPELSGECPHPLSAGEGEEVTGTHFPSFSSHEKQSFYMLLEVSKKSSPHSLSKHLSIHPWLPPTPILLSHFSLGTTHKLLGVKAQILG